MKLVNFTWEVQDVPREIHVVPMGEWKDRDFAIGEAECAEIVENFKRFGIRLVIDYEHQTLNTEQNGVPAPAAGWIGDLEVRENGVWGTQVEWTAEGQRRLEAKEYRYLSPVLVFDDHDPHTGEAIGVTLHSAALTNTPYFRSDLVPVAARRAQSAEQTEKSNEQKADKTPRNEENSMSDQEKITALEADNAKLSQDIEALKNALAESEARIAAAETAKLVEDAISAKRLLPAQKEAALIVARNGKDALEKFLAANVATDLSKNQDIPGKKAGEEKYEDLLNDPQRLIKLKQEAPEAFNAMRAAFYKE